MSTVQTLAGLAVHVRTEMKIATTAEEKYLIFVVGIDHQ
jgi:hypothetical protein